MHYEKNLTNPHLLANFEDGSRGSPMPVATRSREEPSAYMQQKMVTLVLQLQGTEFCQQPERLVKLFSPLEPPDRNTILPIPLSQSSETLPARLFDLLNCKVMNLLFQTILLVVIHYGSIENKWTRKVNKKNQNKM